MTLNTSSKSVPNARLVYMTKINHWLRYVIRVALPTYLYLHSSLYLYVQLLVTGQLSVNLTQIKSKDCQCLAETLSLLPHGWLFLAVSTQEFNYLYWTNIQFTWDHSQLYCENNYISHQPYRKKDKVSYIHQSCGTGLKYVSAIT